MEDKLYYQKLAVKYGIFIKNDMEKIKIIKTQLGKKDILKSRVLMAKCNIPFAKIRDPFKKWSNVLTDQDDEKIRQMLLCIKIDLQLLLHFEEFSKTFNKLNRN
jgi:hypothetical protein